MHKLAHAMKRMWDRRSENDAPLCPICLKLDIWRMLYDGLLKADAIYLDTLSNVLSRAADCALCSLISTVVRRTWLLDKRTFHADLSEVGLSIYAEDCGCLRLPEPPTRELAHRLSITPSTRPAEILAAMIAAETNLLLEIQVMEEDAHQLGRKSELHGRVVKETVDVERLKGWTALCEKEHGAQCKDLWWRKGEETSLPPVVRVVDVQDMSIVSVSPDCRYVALSYLWGRDGSSYWTTKENLPWRTQPGGLPISVLPTTISDTVLLMRQMGERYLWVDALCIVQDDLDDKAAQIHFMERIYGYAVFTVFAAGGISADAPLPGFRPGTRTVAQRLETIQGLRLAVPLPTPRESLAHTHWDTRGWTYQELMLSRRRIFFTPDQVYFECSRDTWAEDLAAESNGKALTRNLHPLGNAGGGRVTFMNRPPAYVMRSREWVVGYMSRVTDYSERKLTVEDDVVNAITALTNAFAQGFELAGGNPAQAFRYAMAITDLDQTLLWQPQPDSRLIRRGVVDGDSTRSPWPSWAWAGWVGAVRYASDMQFVALHDSHEWPRPMESLVNQWHVVEMDGGGLVHLDIRPIKRIVFDGTMKGLYEPPRWDGAVWDAKVADLEMLRAGTLVFRTTISRMVVEKLEPADGHVSEHHVLFNIFPDSDADRRHFAGRIILPRSHPSPSQMQLVVLSRMDGVDQMYDAEFYGRPYEGCILYVMAVKEIDGADVRERLGVGIVFEKAWLDAKTVDDIVLLR